VPPCGLTTSKNANTLSQLSGFTIGTPPGQTCIHKHCTPSQTQQNLTENCRPFAVMISHTKFELSRIISNRSSPQNIFSYARTMTRPLFFLLFVVYRYRDVLNATSDTISLCSLKPEAIRTPMLVKQHLRLARTAIQDLLGD